MPFVVAPEPVFRYSRNRAFFHEQLQHAVALRKEPGHDTALLFVDLNHFKEVNDRFGHDVGDAVLARLGRRIQRTVRAGDGDRKRHV